MSITGLAIALLTATVQPAAPVLGAPDDATVEAFLHRASVATGSPVKIDQMRQLGRNKAIARSIVEQVLDGRKRVTVARRAEYVEKGWPLPKVGQTVLVYDFDGKPSFIYRVVATQELPLEAVAPWHLMAESPALRDLSTWRTAHLGAWKGATEGMNPEQLAKLPLVWMRFEPVFPVASPPH
jgi:uncharacterized protein YhfF